MAIQFPNNPGIGSVFTDTDAGFSYEWTGVVWKSFTPAAASSINELDDISSGFNGSTKTFNLTIGGEAYSPRSSAMLMISLTDVIQEPTTDYSVNGTTITFASAPASDATFFGVARGTAVAIDYANNGNIQTKQEFTATLGQTSFTITGGYTEGYIDVFRNGVRLGSSDFTDTSETAIVLATPAQAGDLIETIKYNVASLVVGEGQLTNLNVTGVSTVGVVTGATSIKSGVFYGPLTGNVTGNVTGNATGLSGTPNISVGSVTAASGSFSGNVTIGGTLTYTDVTNIDSVGIITAQKGLQVLANGVDVTGIGTFEDRLTYDGSLGQSGGSKVTYAVTVASKNSTHRYNGSGSSNGYVIDNLQAPVLTLTPGRTYFFDQADSTNSGHPLRFYLEADKTTSYTTNVTAGSISAGTAGAGVTIVIGDSTPNVLHYQCSSHGYMGNSAISQSNVAGAFNVVDESSDTSCNVLFTTDATGTALEAKTGTNLTFNSNTGALTATSFAGELTGAAVTTSSAGLQATNVDFAGLLREQVFVTAGKLSDNTNIDLENGMVHLFTTAETTTATPNLRVDSSTSLNSTMAIGEAISVTIVTTAAAAGYAATVNIDGATVGTNGGTLNWTGGSAPSDGGSSGVDITAYTIMKTADATYTVIASQTKTSA